MSIRTELFGKSALPGQTSGELAIDALLPPAKVSAIRSYLIENKAQTLGEAKYALGDDVTYSDIQFVYNAMRAEMGETGEM